MQHDLSCNYTFVEPEATPLLGYLPQDILSMSVFEMHHPDDLTTLHDIYKKGEVKSRSHTLTQGTADIFVICDMYIEWVRVSR